MIMNDSTTSAASSAAATAVAAPTSCGLRSRCNSLRMAARRYRMTMGYFRHTHLCSFCRRCPLCNEGDQYEQWNIMCGAEDFKFPSIGIVPPRAA